MNVNTGLHRVQAALTLMLDIDSFFVVSLACLASALLCLPGKNSNQDPIFSAILGDSFLAFRNRKIMMITPQRSFGI